MPQDMARISKKQMRPYLNTHKLYPCALRDVQVISAENYVGWSEGAKCSAIAKVFDDAYKVWALCIAGFFLEHT